MIGAAVTSVLRWITGDLTGALERAHARKLQAQTDEEKLAADERIKTLHARQEVILAAQGDPIERFVRIGFAAPFVIYIWKVVVWDKVFGWGVTDGLSSELSNIMMLVLGGYFVDTAIRRVWKR